MSKPFPQISVTDLINQVSKDSTPVIGRQIYINRLSRQLNRQQNNNLALVGLPGTGKTTLLTAYVRSLLKDESAGTPKPYLSLDINQLVDIFISHDDENSAARYLRQAFVSLPPSVVVIDDIDLLLNTITDPWNLITSWQPFLTQPTHSLITIGTESPWDELYAKFASPLKSFSKIKLPEADHNLCAQILKNQIPRLQRQYQVSLSPNITPALLDAADQTKSPRAMPDHLLQLADEVFSAANTQKLASITPEFITQVINEQLGHPILTNNKSKIKNLESRLQQRVKGQDVAIRQLSRAVQAASLGIKDPKKPFASMLFFGPSGVGKTELAKTIAQEVFGSESAMLRLDMSEFSDKHTTHRLLGAPPGYIGHEAGGQLTNWLVQHPYSLILLDEIEKADAAVFDIFLQLLDDGRITDEHGRTVNATKTIIIATSNCGVSKIISGAINPQQLNQTSWFNQHLLPELLKQFRPEFINRFTHKIVFQPLSPTVLLQIANKEITKIQQRFSQYNVTINANHDWLLHHINRLYDPRLGARPLKQFLEQTCEAEVIKKVV